MPVPSLNARKRDPPTGVMSGASISRSVRLPYPTMHAGRLDPRATWRQQCRVVRCIVTEPVPGRQVCLRPRLAQMFSENAVAPREFSLASLSDACVKKALCDTDGRGTRFPARHPFHHRHSPDRPWRLARPVCPSLSAVLSLSACSCTGPRKYMSPVFLKGARLSSRNRATPDCAAGAELRTKAWWDLASSATLFGFGSGIASLTPTQKSDSSAGVQRTGAVSS